MVGRPCSAGRTPALGEIDTGAIRPGRPVIAVCRSGNRSGKAADLHAAAGVTVHNQAGGMKGWAQAGCPVVTDSGKPGIVA